MTTEEYDDRAQRAVAELRSTYDGTSLPDAVKCRIAGAVFAPRSRTPGPMKLAAAFGLAAVIVALAAAWVFYPLPNEDVPNATKTAPYTAIVQKITGSADVTLPNSTTTFPAAAQMHIDGASMIATAPHSAVVLGIGPHEVTVISDTRLDLMSLDRIESSFRMERGRARFDVAHLAHGERFAVTAGDLTVEVVGTRFEVYFDGDCPAVSVDEGKVRASFRKSISFVVAGVSRRFCDPASSDVASLALGASSDSRADLGGSAPKARSPQVAIGTEVAEARLASPASAADMGSAASAPQSEKAPVSEEERLYLEALASRVRGDLPLASEQMADYLEKYPNGAFAEEALFSIVRFEYRRRDFAEVRQRGANYVEQYPGRNAKSDEVRILYAESLHRLGAGSGTAVEILAPLVRDVDSVAGPYREQALYLYFKVAADTGQAPEAKRVASSYLERYPSGQYADAAKALVEGK